MDFGLFMKKICNNILFYTVWALGLILGLMPRFIWLILADILYVILYKIIRYRVKVTKENLRLSFPEKSEKERKWIERRFYLYLMDIFVETIALIGISKRRISKKMKFINTEEFNAECEKKSVIVALAHYASWELTVSYGCNSTRRLLPVYHPLASDWADKLFLDMRKRFGAEPVSMRMVGRKLIETKNDKIILVLIADQTPPRFEKSEWVTFLNQDTMFFSGIENISLKYNMPVYFFDIDCIKRGYYEGKFVKLYDGEEDVDQYEISRRYIRYLERKIRNKPEFWMWSHKRWKHKKF